MAVQKSKKSRSKRGSRRAHDSLTASSLSEDPLTGEKHLRHNMSPNGYYKGRKIVVDAVKDEDDDSSEE